MADSRGLAALRVHAGRCFEPQFAAGLFENLPDHFAVVSWKYLVLVDRNVIFSYLRQVLNQMQAALR